MRRWYLLLILVLFPATAFSMPELKGSPEDLQRYLLDERSIIVISGSGEEKVQSDTAVVSLVVKTKEDKFRTALDKNSRIRKDIKDRMIAGGIPQDKVEAAKYSSTPTYSWLGDKPSSYEISNEIKVSIDKEDQLLVVADIVDSVNEVHFVRTELRHTKSQESRTKALEKSLDDMNVKKRLYEKSLGVTLSPVRVIQQTVFEDIPAGYQVQRKTFAKGAAVSAEDSAMEEGSSGFGEVIYKAQTQAEFIVHQKRQ